VPGATSISIIEEGPLRVALKLEFKLSEKSSLEQIVYLCADSPILEFETNVEWHEGKKTKTKTKKHNDGLEYKKQFL
jgi:alpha-mannosidase